MSRVLLVVLALVVVAVAVIFKLFGWIGLVICLIPAFLFRSMLPRIAGYLFGMFATQVVKQKGNVLCGAEVVLHAVSAAPTPEQSADTEDGDSDPDEQQWDQPLGELPYEREWVYLDLTITPRPADQQDASWWEPSMLLLFEPQQDDVSVLDDCRSMGEIASVAVWEDGRFVEDDQDTFYEAARLRLQVGLRPGTEQLRFVYYMSEEFGDVDLADQAAAAGTS